MKIITLIRHAKSDWSQLWQKDFDRTLASRGHKQSKILAKILKNLKYSADKIICSQAKRALLTHQNICENYQDFGKIPTEFQKEIYDFMNASWEDFLDFMRFFDDNENHIIIIGHNEVFNKFLQITTGNMLHIPTSTFVEIIFETEHWAEISRGKLSKFILAR